MEVSSSSSTHPDFKALTQNALNSNKAHQYALTEYAEKLNAELQELETLLAAANVDNGEDEIDTEVQIPGANKPSSPCPISEFLNPDSPFYEDASRRTRYLNNTSHHPMKPRELKALADAVKSENQRLQAYQLQRSGQVYNVPIDIENNIEGLDWTMIAEKVSMASNINRTADQCRIKWLGDRHPRINHCVWSTPELENLQRLITEQQAINDGKVDWVHVASQLGTNRTPIDCMRHGIPRKRHTWDKEYDEKLSDAVQRYGINNWSIVARVVSEDATAAQCQGRYFRALDPSLKKGNWSPAEFDRLKAAVAAYGKSSWMEVAACIPGRTNEQCRERWTEYEGIPSARTKWSEEDDEALLEAVETMGNQWKVISIKLGNGTTGPQCRLRHDKILRQRAAQLAIAAGSPSDSMSMTPEPQTRARSAAARQERPGLETVYKGRGEQKETETTFDETATMNTSSVFIGDQSPEQSVEDPSRPAANKRSRESGAGAEEPPAKKMKTLTPGTGTSPRKDIGQPGEPRPGALEIVEETGNRPRKPIGRPRKAPRKAKNAPPRVVSPPPPTAVSEDHSVPPSIERSRPRPRPLPPKQVAEGGSITEVASNAHAPSKTSSASCQTSNAAPQEETPRRHSARVAAKQTRGK